MRCLAVVGVAAALLSHQDAVVHGRSLLDFDAETASASLRGAGTVVGGDSSAAVDVSEVSVPSTAVSASSLQPQSIMFNSAGSLDVGTLIVDEEASSPVASNASSNIDLVNTTASAIVRFTVLPPSDAVDVQGFPFLVSTPETNTKESVSTTNGTAITSDEAFAKESDAWIEQVCSGRKTSCMALQPIAGARRRLDDDTSLDQDAMKAAVANFIIGYSVDGITELVTNCITNGAMMAAGMAFSFAIQFALPSFAGEWQKVTSKLQDQARAVLNVAVKAETDMDFINERGYLIKANQRANSFAIQRLSYGADLSMLCAQDGGPEVHFETYFSNAQRYRETLKSYCSAVQDCVLKNGLYYVKSLAQPYTNALACYHHREKDSQKFKTQAKALLTRANTLITDFVNDSEDVRDKLLKNDPTDPTVSNIQELFDQLKKKDEEGAAEYLKSDIVSKFDWLDFTAIVSEATFTKCAIHDKLYVEPKQDKGVGMLISLSNTVVVLQYKQKKNAKGTVYNEVLKTPALADSRAEEIKAKCGEDHVYGMIMVAVRGGTADISKGPTPFQPKRRHLVETYNCGGFRLMAVCGEGYVNTTSSADIPLNISDSTIDGVIKEGSAGAALSTDLNPQAVADYFNTYADDQKTVQDLVDHFGTEEWVRGMAMRDPAVLAYAQLGIGLINQATKQEVKQIDHVSTVLDETHQAQVTALNGVNNKLIETHGKEMSGLRSMENDMTKYHQEEITMYDTIDTHVTTLGSTISQGFSETDSKVSQVDAAVSGKLSGLNDLIGSTAQQTRENVVAYLRETTTQTLSSLDGLEEHIKAADQQTLQSVSEVRNKIVETQTQLRTNIVGEFQKQQVAFQDNVMDASQLVEQVGQRVLFALLNDVDMVNGALTQQLSGIGEHVDVVKGRLVAVEKGFDELQEQVDKMLLMLSTIQQRTNRVFRTLQNFPQKIAAILLEGEVKKRLDDFKKLNYAFTRFVENGMRPLYRSEMIMACDAYSKAGDLLYYFTGNVGVEGGMDAVVKHFRKFEFNRADYEKFGGQTIVAAYGVQRLSLTCAYLKEDLTREQFIQRATLWDKEIDAAMYRFQMNVEEIIPRYFLAQHYTSAMVQGYLDEAKLAAGITTTAVSTSKGEFALGAIEQLRYRIQQDLGSFASVSVLNVQDSSSLRVWSKLPAFPAKAAQNRQGLTQPLPTVVLLWSNTRKELPVDLREKMKLNLRAADLVSNTTLAAAFKGSVFDKYWASGVIQSVVYTDKVAVTGSAKACPWAISSTHYPLCWETTNATGSGGCACVQIEGLSDLLSAEQLTAKSLVPSYYTLTTTLADADEPRSSFLITAAPSVATSLAGTSMLGVPESRVSFAACMTSASPTPVCDVATATGANVCHQPPPTYKRCVADNVNAYSIVYATANATANATTSFITSGLTVTDEMFRTLELGATLPQITFFDEPNGQGNYVVCKNCVMRDFRTVYMFRIMSFKIGRPIQEKDAVCTTHPRLKNVEYCPRSGSQEKLWTSQVLVETELIQRVVQIGEGIPQGTTDAQTLASLVNDGMQQLVSNDFSFFKVYVAKSGSFNTTTNANAYWTSLPSQEAGLERGWTVVPAFYTTVLDDDTTLTFDALVMWSTLPVEARNFAKLVVEKKPAGQPLKTYLQSTFAAYDREKILRGFFSEPFDGLDCPVAGDTDHFAYCTPVPVDKMCSCVQLEDLPEEYTELYDGSAINGKVVSYVLEDDQSAYIVGRSKGSFSLGDRVASATWDGLPMRNVSAHTVCVSDYNHPELGATCVNEDAVTTSIDYLLPPTASVISSSGVAVGEGVSTVTIDAPTWSSQCSGCTGEFLAQMLQLGGENAAIQVGGYVAGVGCRKALAPGGGVLTTCLR